MNDLNHDLETEQMAEWLSISSRLHRLDEAEMPAWMTGDDSGVEIRGMPQANVKVNPEALFRLAMDAVTHLIKAPADRARLAAPGSNGMLQFLWLSNLNDKVFDRCVTAKVLAQTSKPGMFWFAGPWAARASAELTRGAGPAAAAPGTPRPAVPLP